MQSINDHSQTVTYNRKYEQRTNNIYFSILWDLEILGRPNWESIQLTLIGKGPVNGPYKVWLMLWLCRQIDKSKDHTPKQHYLGTKNNSNDYCHPNYFSRTGSGFESVES